MKNLVLCLIILLLLPAFANAATWGGDHKIMKNSINGDPVTGIFFDPDNDGINEATMDALGMLQLGTLTSDPCTAAKVGTIFWNDTAKEMCVCNGSNDVRIKDASTACF